MGIPLGICSQEIQHVSYHKPSIKKHRRLNMSMEEVIKKEIIKCLIVEFIYPIKDSN